MGLIDIASSKSVWRGMEYYKQNKVLSYTVNEDGSCEGIVGGSGDGNYLTFLYHLFDESGLMRK